jgi:FMN-binding protein
MTMKRAPLFAAGAVAGFAGLIGYHSLGAPALAGLATGPAGQSAPGTPGRGDAHHRHAGRPGSGPGQAPASGTLRAATGPLVNFGYGTIAVRVKVSGNRITAVSVAALQTLEPTSQYICAQAIPILRSEVLSVQSAAINGVSGASYTSAGYARSLQGALDALRAR